MYAELNKYIQYTVKQTLQQHKTINFSFMLFLCEEMF